MYSGSNEIHPLHVISPTRSCHAGNFEDQPSMALRARHATILALLCAHPALAFGAPPPVLRVRGGFIFARRSRPITSTAVAPSASALLEDALSDAPAPDAPPAPDAL